MTYQANAVGKLGLGGALVAFAVGTGMVVACDKVSGDDQSGGEEGTAVDAGSDGTASADDAGSSDAAYVEVDAVRRTDASGLVDQATCGSRTPCDCDDDGFASVSCPVDAGSLLSSRGTPLRPGDCDDLDPLRFPGQSYVAEAPPPGRNGDWNCDGAEEHWRTVEMRACRVADGTCLVGQRGFLGVYACGTVGELFECGFDPQNPEGCGPVRVGVARQPCR